MDNINTHNFKFGGGKKIVDGKSHWPDCLYLNMSRRDAWRVVHSMIDQLRDEDEPEIIFSALGKLDINTKEE